MANKIEELEIRSQNKGSRLKDKNRNKMKLVANNKKRLYDFRNKIINKIKRERGKYVENNKETELINKLVLHRPEEKLEGLIKNIQEDTDLKNEFSSNSARSKLLEFLNDVIDKIINSEKEAKRVYVNNFLTYKQELENKKLHDGSRSQRIKNFINYAEYIIFSTLFNSIYSKRRKNNTTNKTKFTNRRRRFIRVLKKKSPESDSSIGEELKIMTPNKLDKLFILCTVLKICQKQFITI